MKRTISEGGVYHSIQCPRVARKVRLCAREKVRLELLCLDRLVRGLRHTFAASSALGRHRNKRDLPLPELRDS